MALKVIKALYQSKNNITGLTDVKAQVYVNSVAKAVAGSAIALTELDSTNAPGDYLLVISPATLAGWGVVAGDDVEIRIDSASKSAAANIRVVASAVSTDDIDSKIGSPAGVSVSADIASVKSDTSAIKADLESGASSLATILSSIQAIQNNAGFAVPVPATMIKPASGSNSYRVPLTIYNEKNALLDPDSNSIVVSLVNQSGADRSSYLTGVSGSVAPAVRDSQGQYHIDVTIPSTSSQEELLFNFAYAIGGSSTARRAVTEIITDVAADGFALQSTLLSVQTTVYGTNAIVADPTSGNAAIQAMLANGTFGLSALQTIEAANQATLTNGTYGLSALHAGQVAIEGAGFVGSSDSLHAISQYLQDNVFSGGRAV